MPEVVLYDQFNRPIQRDRLKVEESGPTIAGVRQIVSDHPWQGMTPYRLSQVLRSAEDGDATAQMEIAEEMEEKDLHYRSVLSTRRLQVSQVPITIEAASDEADDQRAADLVRELLVDTGVVSDYLFDMLDAVGKGYSIGEIVWQTTASRWSPLRVEWRQPQWFEFDRTDGCTPLVKGGATGTGMPEPLKPYGYVVHIHKTKSGLPIRGGLARACAWLCLFKNFDLRAWIEFLEGFGQPVRLGKYKNGASEKEKAELLRAVRSMWKDSAAIIPDGMVIEWLEAKVTGNTTLQQSFAEWVDRQISKAILGQTGTTDVGQHVGTAQAHDKVKDDIERDDGRQAGITINRDLVRPVVDLNLGPRERYPRLVIARPDAVDLKLFMANVKTFVDLGGEVEQSVVRDKLGLPDPAPGPEVKLLRPTRQAAPADGNPGALATQSQRPGEIDAPDPVDDIEAAGLDGWEAQMAPVIDPVRALIAGAASYEEAIAGIGGLLVTMDTDRLVAELAKAAFLARAAGDVSD